MLYSPMLYSLMLYSLMLAHHLSSCMISSLLTVRNAWIVQHSARYCQGVRPLNRILSEISNDSDNNLWKSQQRKVIVNAELDPAWLIALAPQVGIASQELLAGLRTYAVSFIIS